MQSFFYHILSSPPVYAKILAEIESAVHDGVVPRDGNVAWAEAQNLPYVQACLKEAMRVRPAVGLNITRVVPPEGAELDGHRFPGGVTVAANGWVLHRDKEVFGEDAEEFRPERWVESEEAGRRMERCMFQVSSSSFSVSWCGRVLMNRCSLVVAVICALGGIWHCSR